VRLELELTLQERVAPGTDHGETVHARLHQETELQVSKRALPHPVEIHRGRPFGLFVSQERNYRSKALKQADALMLAYLFPSEFPLAQVAATYDYYEPFTTHDSSLSCVIHAILHSVLYPIFDSVIHAVIHALAILDTVGDGLIHCVSDSILHGVVNGECDSKFHGQRHPVVNRLGHSERHAKRNGQCYSIIDRVHDLDGYAVLHAVVNRQHDAQQHGQFNGKRDRIEHGLYDAKFDTVCDSFSDTFKHRLGNSKLNALSVEYSQFYGIHYPLFNRQREPDPVRHGAGVGVDWQRSNTVGSRI